MPKPELSQEQQDKLQAAVQFIGRTGATQVQMRFHDDEKPIIWLAVAVYADGRADTDASLDPVRAALRLCERLADGGTCTHCGRTTGLEPDSLDTMPLDELVCWYQFDPELKTFRRGCE